MSKFVAVVVMMFCLLSAGSLIAKDKSANGVYRPTLSTSAKKYLREFQLGKATQDEVIQYVGMPDKSNTIGGSEFLTYSIAPKTSSGVIEYTYELKEGVVVNVTYLNSGNFFGVTQRESATELQQSP